MSTEIIEGNKLIAEFMGGSQKEDQMYIPDHVAECYKANCLVYDSSWDWLMPVVEQIENLGYYTEINKKINGGNYVHIADNSLNKDIANSFGLESKIEAMWQAVVEFIKWYNTK